MIQRVIYSFVAASILTGTPVSAQKSEPVVKSISIYRNEIQLDTKRNPEIRVGSKLLAKLPVPHKCLLVVTRVIGALAYADATQCPGYGTMKKGQSVEISVSEEINEEVRSVPAETKEKS